MEYHQEEIDKHILTLTFLSLMHQKNDRSRIRNHVPNILKIIHITQT